MGACPLHNPNDECTTFQHDPAGRRTAKLLANSTRTSFTYDEASRVTRIVGIDSLGTTITQFDDTWKYLDAWRDSGWTRHWSNTGAVAMGVDARVFYQKSRLPFSEERLRDVIVVDQDVGTLEFVEGEEGADFEQMIYCRRHLGNFYSMGIICFELDKVLPECSLVRRVVFSLTKSVRREEVDDLAKEVEDLQWKSAVVSNPIVAQFLDACSELCTAARDMANGIEIG